MFHEHEGRTTLSEVDHTRSLSWSSNYGGQGKLGTASACPLKHILGLLDSLKLEIDEFMRTHGHPENTDDDSALSWMHTAVEDISATLVGISYRPQHRMDS